MRARHLLLACLLVASAQAATADPITAPGATWNSGEGREFELLWNGSVGTFSVEGLGTSVYTSLSDCCSDVFDRVRVVNPGSSLTFSGLVLNWYMPISPVIEDDLDWSLLGASGFDNLRSLTGLVTLTTSPLARLGEPVLNVNVGIEGGATQGDSEAQSIPEPGALMLVGTGLVGLAAVIRRRMARSANKSADPRMR